MEREHAASKCKLDGKGNRYQPTYHAIPLHAPLQERRDQAYTLSAPESCVSVCSRASFPCTAPVSEQADIRRSRAIASPAQSDTSPSTTQKRLSPSMSLRSHTGRKPPSGSDHSSRRSSQLNIWV